MFDYRYFCGFLLGGCLMAQETYGYGKCTPQPAAHISIPPVTLAAPPVVGEVMGNADGYFFGADAGLICYYYGHREFHTSWARVVNSQPTALTFSAMGLTMPVFATNVPGVGFAMMAQDPNRPLRAIGLENVGLYGTPDEIRYWGVHGRVFLVATGPVTGGTINGFNVGRFTLDKSDINSPGYHAINFNATVIHPPRKPTCTVSTPGVNMALGTIATHDFQGPGSTAGSVTESIALDCAAGTGSKTDVLITLTDQSQPANRSDVLSLSNTSTAQGVALQLLHGTTLVRYGPDSSAIGNPNQWLAGSTGNGVFRIPLTARYVQTDTRIIPGKANGVATFTLSYR